MWILQPKNASFEGSKKAPSEEVFWALETSFLRFRQNKKNSLPNLQNFGQLLEKSFFDLMTFFTSFFAPYKKAFFGSRIFIFEILSK